MEFAFTLLYLVVGTAAVTSLVLSLRKTSPRVKFIEVSYDKLKNEVHLVVENLGEKTAYVRPAIRLVRLMHADEWKQTRSALKSTVPMMAASAGGLVKGYDLIGEYAVPVEVAPKTAVMIKYPVRGEFGFKAYDNVKVDSPVGEWSQGFDRTVTGMLRLNLLGCLEGYNGEKNQRPSGSARSEFPVHAICHRCGRERWLNWVVGQDHMCEDCKDFIGKNSSSDYKIGRVSDDDDDYPEPVLGMEFVEAQPVDLKPRHKRILDLLNDESTVSARDIANKLGRARKSVADDLRFLLRNNLVDRVKIGGRYKYFSLREGEQVILYDPSEGEKSGAEIELT